MTAVTQTPESVIRSIRGQRVILDADLAVLYDVTTSAVNQSVRRNPDRFPPDFMFQLTHPEVDNLLSQTVISSWGGRRHLPYAFTQEGVAMLSSVLRSPRAVRMNVGIMRAFVRMRDLMLTNQELALRVAALEQGHQSAQNVIEAIVADIDRLANEIHDMQQLPEPPKRQFGFAAPAG